MPGPAPKPIPMRVIEGGIGKGGADRSHRPRRETPTYAPLDLKPPRGLPTESRREWKRLMAEFARYPGLVQRTDFQSMYALCFEWGRYVDANKRSLDKTLTQKQRKEEIRIARDALAKLLPMWQRFGMTPGDRARIHPEVGECDEDDDLLTR